MNYPTCGEISCEECNDRYEKAMKRIAELEAMVRELVDKGPPGDYRREWRAALYKAFALLNQEERKP